MNNPETKQGNFKKKIVHELGEYLIIVCYLTLVFAAFTQYRRILLSAYGIDYMNYGVAVIEALILGKVVMIGDILRLGRGLEQKPLIYPTLLKTFVFTVFVAAFTLIEHAIKGLWQGKGLTGGLIELSENGYHELLANSLVVFVAFIPFFAVKELQRVFGVGELRALFFKNRVDP